ncbi:5955_t:CDS:1 [Paraglomus occultum]|uniref:5950_t:CDS:1 n=1 Tax=Paraglomus occultum TaxID=144539 RepID=A0A9N8WHJ0_9GLOM|nr:5950_t:CDS:1 [Paraglomus occultum]CAG8487457.1 5955_t:CDS:1 [Paraglomus occultum]
MISGELILLLTIISLPTLTRKGTEYLNARNNSASSNQARTPKIDGILILTALCNLYLAFFSSPPNIFRTLNAPINTPSFTLRVLLEKNKQPLSLYYLSLLDKLQSYESRLKYLAFGEHAFMQCTYCRDAIDYLYFIVPSNASYYILMSCIIGIVTITRSKAHWRTYGVISLAGFCFYEFYTFASTDIRDIQPSHPSLFSTIHFYRHLFFAILSILVIVITQEDIRTDSEILASIERQQRSISNQIRGSRLQRATAMRDPELRKTYVNYYKGKGDDYARVESDAEYVNMRERLLSELSLEREARAYVDSIISMKNESEIDGGSSSIGE